MKLHVVKSAEGGQNTRQRRVRSGNMLECHRCGGREVLLTRIGAHDNAGRLVGGTVQGLCAVCFLDGQRVVIG